MKAPSPPVFTLCQGLGSREKKLPLERTTGDPRGAKSTGPSPQTRLRFYLWEDSGGNRARTDPPRSGAKRHLPLAGQTDKAWRLPRASPRRGTPALARPRRPLGNAGEGKAGEGSRDPELGRQRRREEPQKAGKAGKGRIDAACGPMTSELGRTSRQRAVPPGARGGHWGRG